MTTTPSAAAEEAIKRLIRDGAAVTFQAVQREAGVSHSFLYGHPVLRRRIEQLRVRQAPKRIAQRPRRRTVTRLCSF
ncbi:DUF6262 family protein [Nonomuraea sp. NPDC049625]|uniref:DUF6262 family protein n=1 Tax=Nonomuraea sp. NPDC049625 TaxID=3155775 RepID=UPI00343F6004